MKINKIMLLLSVVCASLWNAEGMHNVQKMSERAKNFERAERYSTVKYGVWTSGNRFSPLVEQIDLEEENGKESIQEYNSFDKVCGLAETMAGTQKNIVEQGNARDSEELTPFKSKDITDLSRAVIADSEMAGENLMTQFLHTSIPLQDIKKTLHITVDRYNTNQIEDLMKIVS